MLSPSERAALRVISEAICAARNGRLNGAASYANVTDAREVRAVADAKSKDQDR